MTNSLQSRRQFLKITCAMTLGLGKMSWDTLSAQAIPSSTTKTKGFTNSLLEEFGYEQIMFAHCLQKTQFDQTMEVILGLNDDSMLKPFRQRAGVAAPGLDLGGWYDNFDGCDMFHQIERGFAPGHCLGQWISALARGYAMTGSKPMQQKMNRLLAGYSELPLEKYYKGLRYPAYTYDKFVCAYTDAYKWADYKDGLKELNAMTDKIVPMLPEKALDHDEMRARPHIDESYCWDESYTISENLFIAFDRGAGERYKELGIRYLKDDTYFNPLSEGKNVLPDHHAYSYMNALNSAAKAYLATGSEKHLRAAKNAFDMIQDTQSFATGGWGPDECFVAVEKGNLGDSLTKTHKSFETPCGAYAHFKLSRYLLRISRDAKYGDSMEQVMYNTILGAKPLQSDGRGFYYSDYNFDGQKYYRYAWNCCTGTLPQVAADYTISTYFREPQGVYVNLYIPSTLKWEHNDTQLSLTQHGNYPSAENVHFVVNTSKPVEYALHFRIPNWCDSTPTLHVNGKPASIKMAKGSFVELKRTWRDGDRLELKLPMRTRLTAVDDKNLDTVALSYGPLVLFALVKELPTVTRKALLSAKRVSDGIWEVATSTGDIKMVPFTAIDKEHYSTYLKVT